MTLGMPIQRTRGRRFYVVRWTLAGTLFGAFFPLIAWRIAALEMGSLGFAELHAQNPTMWVVDLAPSVLGLVGAAIGLLFTRLAEASAKTEETAKQIAASWTADLHSANLDLADALESRRRFHAAVTHELRSPLTAIVGYTDLADTVAPKPPELGGYLTEIYGAASAMLGMVNDLLDAAKLETGGISIDLTDVHCEEVVRAVAGRLAPLAQQKGLTIEVDVDVDVVCWADPMRLEQVLTNIVANAIKFSDKGTIEIRVALRNDGRPKIEVEDEGPGIKTEDIEKIFGEYESGAHGEGRRDSSGLGLAIGRSLIEAMDGEIMAQSPGPGLGSTFRVILQAPDGHTQEKRLASLTSRS
jgi:signal transduction histidine kinase